MNILKNHSIGFTALVSFRDWIVVLGLISGALGLSEVLLVWSVFEWRTIRSTLIGGLIGMLPSILVCLPVHGIVDGLSHNALYSFLKSENFTPSSDREGIQVYTPNTPAWSRWDSNRVTIKSLPSGQLSVTMPVYCYRALKKWC